MKDQERRGLKRSLYGQLVAAFAPLSADPASCSDQALRYTKAALLRLEMSEALEEHYLEGSKQKAAAQEAAK